MCFSKWWVKWPVILFAVPILLAVMYLLTFNWVTDREDKKFVKKWQPLIGSLKHEDVFPAIPESEDLAKDPMFLKLVDSEYRKSWNVMGFIGEEDEMDEYGYAKAKALFDDPEGMGETVVDMQAWYGKEGMSDKQIAEEALEKLAEVDGDIDELEKLLDKYTRVSGVMNGLVAGEAPYGENLAIHIIKFSRIFSERALLHAHIGDGELVLRDLSYIRKLQLLTKADTTLIGFLLEVAGSASETLALEYCLKQKCFSEGQLRKLLTLMVPPNFAERLANTVKGEYLYAKAVDVHLRTNNGELPSAEIFGQTIGGGTGGLMPKSAGLAMALKIYNFQLRYQFYAGGKLVERLTIDHFDNVMSELEQSGGSLDLRWRAAKPMAGLYVLLPMKIAMEWQVRREVAQLAVACEVYKVDRGAYPDDLTQLVPKYVSELQTDPFRPTANYLYKIGSGGFPILYSVGNNGLDDGGVYSKEVAKYDTLYQADIVWGEERELAP